MIFHVHLSSRKPRITWVLCYQKAWGSGESPGAAPALPGAADRTLQPSSSSCAQVGSTCPQPFPLGTGAKPCGRGLEKCPSWSTRLQGCFPGARGQEWMGCSSRALSSPGSSDPSSTGAEQHTALDPEGVQSQALEHPGMVSLSLPTAGWNRKSSRFLPAHTSLCFCDVRHPKQAGNQEYQTSSILRSWS